MFLVRRMVILIALGVCIRAAVAAPTSAPSDFISKLIQQLGDPDPGARQRAAQKLTEMGATARPALVKAAQAGSLQIASRATDLLMKLPWSIASDPDRAREALGGYGDANNDERKNIIDKLATVPGAEPALLRLVQEEPNDSVAWYAATALRYIENQRMSADLRKLDLKDVRPQLIALAAQAYWSVDRSKSIELFHRVIEQTAEDDAVNDADLDFIYRILITDAMESAQEQQAIDLLHGRIRRALTNGDPSTMVFQLLAFYADHGPTAQLAEDQQDFASYLGKPESVYALARMELRPGGSNLMHDAFASAALVASMTPDSHLRVADACNERAWVFEARQELYAIEQQAGEAARPAAQLFTRPKLIRAAEILEDHAAIAEHLETIFQVWDMAHRSPPDEVIASLTCQRLHVARDTGDTKAADVQLNKLLDNPAPDADSGIEVVNALKAMDRKDQAKVYFDKTYASLKSAIRNAREREITNQQDSSQGEAMNDLAWFCARTGEHADEATGLAERAMALEPENYAYIDTAASAHFAAGDFGEAIRLEKRALLMRPADVFMQRQLHRFEAAAKEKP
jgi:predicted Zn-dependent protease